MAKYKQETQPPGGWTDWINLKMDGYKMACCDCGLVHNLQFRVVKIVKADARNLFRTLDLNPGRYTVLLRAQRNNRATAQVRRYRRKG